VDSPRRDYALHFTKRAATDGVQHVFLSKAAVCCLLLAVPTRKQFGTYTQSISLDLASRLYHPLLTRKHPHDLFKTLWFTPCVPDFQYALLLEEE
jgi:hypothetical protein